MSTADERRELLSRWDDLPRPEGWNQGDEHHLACKVIDALRDLVDGSRLEGERASARTFAESDPEVEAAARAMYVIDPQLSMAGAKTLAKAALQAATHHTDGDS